MPSGSRGFRKICAMGCHGQVILDWCGLVIHRPSQSWNPCHGYPPAQWHRCGYPMISHHLWIISPGKSWFLHINVGLPAGIIIPMNHSEMIISHWSSVVKLLNFWPWHMAMHIWCSAMFNEITGTPQLSMGTSRDQKMDQKYSKVRYGRSSCLQDGNI